MGRAACLCLLLAACATTPGALTPSGDDVALADGTLAARLVHAPYRADQHDATCKPWHEVFAPDGRLLTKGLGGTFPHHRGLFVGWNQVRCGGRSFDFWHCRQGETQRFAGMAPSPTGGAMARIDWLAGDGVPVLHEHRELHASRLDATSFRLEVTIRIAAAAGDVELGGDPHHAGCQFRALQDFAPDGAPKVHYLRPATAVARPNDVWADCAWIAGVLPFAAADGGPVTVLRVEAPGNPPASWSTRPYGRFGAMCTATVTTATPLQLRYAYVVALGERDLPWCERAAAAWR